MTDQRDNPPPPVSRTMALDDAVALAKGELVAGRLPAAESIFRQILASSPRQAQSLHLLGVTLLQSGRADEAIGHIRQSLSLSPGDPAAHANLGCALIKKDRLQEAQAEFEHAISLKGDFAEAWQNLGDVRQRLGRLDESVASYRKALDMAPSSPAIHVGMACVLARQGRYNHAEAACRPGVVDLAPHLADFADTAAAMCELDLVISIDTAAAHLAGALGRPTWTLLPHVTDWRWLLDRTDSPWYPTMRLFRQASPGDWAAVVDRVSAALAELAR